MIIIAISRKVNRRARADAGKPFLHRILKSNQLSIMLIKNQSIICIICEIFYR